MVGMAADGERQDHDPRREVADLGDDDRRRASSSFCRWASGRPAFRRSATPRISAARLGLLGPQVGAAARARLAGREVQDAGAVARVHRLEQRAGAGELDVVAVGGDGQQIDGHEDRSGEGTSEE